MQIFWAGNTTPPDGLPFARVENLDAFHEHALVFIDDLNLIHDDIDPLARIYLVMDKPQPQELPVEVAGVIPRDICAIKAISELYSEIRDLFTIGDSLIASLTEKSKAIQQKQATLIREGKKHTAIIKHASDMIFLLGLSGKITFCNETMHAYLSQGDNLIGKQFMDFVVEEDRAGLKKSIEAGFLKGIPSRMDTRLTLASGKTGTFSLMITPLKEHEHFYALSVIGRDVTELRTMEKRLTVQAKDFECMTKGLSHELRNPLTIIGAYMKRMGKEASGREFNEKYQAIMSSIQRIENMVARIERYESIANMETSFLRVDIGRLIHDLIPSLDLSIPVSIKIWHEIWAFTDPSHLKIALTRTLENASESGSPTIEVHASHYDGYAYIVVRDFGSGIHESPKAIFSPFYSTDPMKVGLGLTEARIAMVKIGGDIEVIPQANPGAIIILKILLDRRHIARRSE